MLHGSLWDPEDDVKVNVGKYVHEARFNISTGHNADIGSGCKDIEAWRPLAVCHLQTAALLEAITRSRTHLDGAGGITRRHPRIIRVLRLYHH